MLATLIFGYITQISILRIKVVSTKKMLATLVFCYTTQISIFVLCIFTIIFNEVASTKKNAYNLTNGYLLGKT